jgi:myo-inositol-1(or 4)-monophosphatase
MTDALFEQVKQAVVEAAALFADRDRAAQVRHKDRTDFVTAVDVAVQERLARELAALAPQVQFMGEEKDNSDIDRAGPVWILDPVDGTTNLVHNFRASAVSLALAEGGQLTMGLVYDPFRQELFSARRGGGAFLNGSPIRVSPARTLAEGLCSVGTNPSCRDQADQTFAWLRAIYDRCHDVRRVGSAAIELCCVAAGRLEGYVERGLKPWDYAAATLIIQEAGGTVTNERGGPMGLFQGGAVVGSNGAIHQELLDVLKTN